MSGPTRQAFAGYLAIGRISTARNVRVAGSPDVAYRNFLLALAVGLFAAYLFGGYVD